MMLALLSVEEIMEPFVAETSKWVLAVSLHPLSVIPLLLMLLLANEKNATQPPVLALPFLPAQAPEVTSDRYFVTDRDIVLEVLLALYKILPTSLKEAQTLLALIIVKQSLCSPMDLSSQYLRQFANFLRTRVTSQRPIVDLTTNVSLIFYSLPTSVYLIRVMHSIPLKSPSCPESYVLMIIHKET